MIITVCLAFLNLVGEPGLDVGQRSLREAFHQSLANEAVEQFRRQHNLVDLEEIYQRRILEGELPTSIEEGQESVEPLIHRTRVLFAKSPWKLGALAQSLSQMLSELSRRWEDGLGFLNFWLLSLIIPLALAFIPVSILFLYSSLPGLLPDFRIRQEWVFSVLLVLALIIVIALKAWWSFLLLLLGLTLIYTKQRVFVLIVYLGVALIPMFSVLSSAAMRFGELCSASFALDTGRTRLEYSGDSIEFLGLLERALWSMQNGDVKATETWRRLADESVQKRFFEIYLESLNQSSVESLKAYQSLLPSSSPALLYNLLQLYTKNQDLIRADEMRAQLAMTTPSLADLEDRARRTRGQLISHDSLDRQHVMHQAAAQVAKETKTLLWDEASLFSRVQLLVFLVSPWLLLALCLRRRQSAHGTCAYTGEPTASPLHEESKAYQTRKLKQEMTRRQQIETQMRMYSSLKRSRIQLWGWLIPDVQSIVERRELVSAWIWLSLVLWLALTALPFHVRADLMASLGFPALAPWSPMTFAPWLLLLAGVIWIWRIWNNRRGDA